jgi:hypothetical protein
MNRVKSTFFKGESFMRKLLLLSIEKYTSALMVLGVSGVVGGFFRCKYFFRRKQTL